jgi:agmatinase
VVHIDAHLDTWDSYFGSRYTHGTFMRRAIEEGVVDARHSVQVGIRGPLFGPEDLAVVERLGLHIVPVEEVLARPLSDVVEAIRRRTGAAPVYVTLDVDSMDPAFAPGTGTPEVGGLTSHQVIGLLHGLVGLSLVGADVVEVSPPYDHGQITALAAARFLHELLSVLAATRRLAAMQTSHPSSSAS